MKRFFTSALVISALSLTVACASKDKKGQEAAAPALGEGAISEKAMEFDPQGSDSGKIEGLKTVHFDFDQSNLTTEARKTLSDNAGWMKSHGNTSIQIEGHCDNRGSVEYNLALGERRAKSVKSYLASLGIEAKRMTMISYGKEKPIAIGDSDEAWAKNRRANFVPLPQ